jgi:hypothetical protein
MSRKITERNFMICTNVVIIHHAHSAGNNNARRLSDALAPPIVVVEVTLAATELVVPLIVRLRLPRGDDGALPHDSNDGELGNASLPDDITPLLPLVIYADDVVDKVTSADE